MTEYKLIRLQIKSDYKVIRLQIRL